MSKLIVLLLSLLFAMTIAVNGHAGIFISKHAAARQACTIVAANNTAKFPQVFGRHTGLRRAFKFGDNGARGGNRNGLISLLFIGGLLMVFAAVVIITPTIPSGLAALLYVASSATSIPAIIFGAKGIRHDRKRGCARLGLILGIAILALMVLFSLLILAVTGTIGF